MIAIALTFGLIVVFFTAAGFWGNLKGVKIFQLVGFGVALIEMIMLAFLLYLNEIAEPINLLLRLNFYLLLGLFVLIAFTWLIFFVFKLINPAEEENDKKWQS